MTQRFNDKINFRNPENTVLRYLNDMAQLLIWYSLAMSCALVEFSVCVCVQCLCMFFL